MFAELIQQRFESNSIHSITDELIQFDSNKVINELLQSIMQFREKQSKYQLMAAITLRQFVECTDPCSFDLSSLLISNLHVFPKAVQLQMCHIISNALDQSILDALLLKCQEIGNLSLLAHVSVGYFREYGDDSDLPHLLESFSFANFTKDPYNCGLIFCHYLQFCYSNDLKIKKRLFKWFSLFMQQLQNNENVELIFKIFINLYTLFPKYTSIVDIFLIQYIVATWSPIYLPFLCVFISNHKTLDLSLIPLIFAEYDAYEPDAMDIEDVLTEFETITPEDEIDPNVSTTVDLILHQYIDHVCTLPTINEAALMHILSLDPPISALTALQSKINNLLQSQIISNEFDNFSFSLYRSLVLHVPITNDYSSILSQLINDHPTTNLLNCFLSFPTTIQLTNSGTISQWLFDMSLDAHVVLQCFDKCRISVDPFILFKRCLFDDISCDLYTNQLYPVCIFVFNNLLLPNPFISECFHHFTKTLNYSLHDAHLMLLQYTMQAISINKLTKDDCIQLIQFYDKLSKTFSDENEFILNYCTHITKISILHNIKVNTGILMHVVFHFTEFDANCQIASGWAMLQLNPTNPQYVMLLHEYSLQAYNIEHRMAYMTMLLRIILDFGMEMAPQQLMTELENSFEDYYSYDFRHLL